MRLVRGRRIVVSTVVGGALIAATLAALPTIHGLSFVVRATDMQGFSRRLANLGTDAAREREIAIPTTRGPLRARLYQPIRRHRRAVLLVSGLHRSGIDEPRLVHFARQLSSDDLAIVTPDIPQLSNFEITPAITDAIERAAVWVASESGLADEGKVGMMGVSFSGGLSLVAAGRPSLTGRVAYVFALGAHDDLPRVLRYLCTGLEPARRQGDATTYRSPHDYGVAVILLGVADHLVPPVQVEPLQTAVRNYLAASVTDSVDKVQGAREFAAVRDLAATLAEPSATIVREITNRDVAHLGPRLLPYIGFYGGDPALSPSKSPKPSAPVFLLHGTEDNVIPAIESEYLADDLRGHAPVRLLLSGLISHAQAVWPVHMKDVLQLGSFSGDLLSR